MLRRRVPTFFNASVKIQFIGFDHLEGEGVHLSPGDELKIHALISLRAPSERAAATREAAAY